VRSGGSSPSIRSHSSSFNSCRLIISLFYHIRAFCASFYFQTRPNLNVLRKTSLALLKSVDWGRIGLKKKMSITALNPDKLLQALFEEK
jgi:hypothetical protein